MYRYLLYSSSSLTCCLCEDLPQRCRDRETSERTLAQHSPLCPCVGHHMRPHKPGIRGLRPPHWAPQLHEECSRHGSQNKGVVVKFEKILLSVLSVGLSCWTALPGDVACVGSGLNLSGLYHREENIVKNDGKKNCKYICYGSSSICSPRYRDIVLSW